MALTETSAHKPLEGRLIYRDAFSIIGVRWIRGDKTSLDEVGQIFKQRRGEIQVIHHPDQDLGVSIHHAKNFLVYYFCHQVPEETPVPEGMFRLHIPARQYAVFTYTGTLQAIASSTYYEEINAWLAQHGYQDGIDEGVPWFEVFKDGQRFEARDHVIQYESYIPLK